MKTPAPRLKTVTDDETSPDAAPMARLPRMVFWALTFALVVSIWLRQRWIKLLLLSLKEVLKLIQEA